MSKQVFRGLLVLVFLLSLVCVAPSVSIASEGDVYIAVSPGIAQCVEDIHASFVAAGGGKLVFVKEATGPLAQKIDTGAPFHLLVAADPKWPKWLEERGKLQDMRVCANGTLVLWAEKEEFCSVEKLPTLRIATPDPETTSHGTLAADYLKSLKLWDDGMASGTIIITKDALHAVLSVQAGSSDVALIPASLAIEVKGTYVKLPTPSLPTVGGLITANPSDVAAAFWNYLCSPEAAPIWEKWGFEPGGHQ